MRNLIVVLGASCVAASILRVPQFELVKALDQPVISQSTGIRHGINNGFEGGLYTKSVDGMYHLFPSECMDDMPGAAWDIHMERYRSRIKLRSLV